ncbi:hypothetical protein MRX96_011195 [Rhipicephalus microplus]
MFRGVSGRSEERRSPARTAAGAAGRWPTEALGSVLYLSQNCPPLDHRDKKKTGLKHSSHETSKFPSIISLLCGPSENAQQQAMKSTVGNTTRFNRWLSHSSDSASDRDPWNDLGAHSGGEIKMSFEDDFHLTVIPNFHHDSDAYISKLALFDFGYDWLQDEIEIKSMIFGAWLGKRWGQVFWWGVLDF